MKSMRSIAPALVAVCLLVAALAWARGDYGYKKKENVEQQIAALSDQVTQASLKGDTDFMEKYFADDYTATHNDGKLSTKAQEIENFKSGAFKLESDDLRERKIRVYGDTVVVIGLASAKGTLGGKPFSSDFRFTRIWVKQQGNWKSVAYQATRVVPASQ